MSCVLALHFGQTLASAAPLDWSPAASQGSAPPPRPLLPLHHLGHGARGAADRRDSGAMSSSPLPSADPGRQTAGAPVVQQWKVNSRRMRAGWSSSHSLQRLHWAIPPRLQRL
ncbi:hypothetical protein GQ55_8G042400 [Panicum hallii var. hallii]|uniref:Uncharacterized protein n=1 Tax=Panicum hallii var. hallii TaxID=1504633 RepID=A0A2T7CKL5_9POAL|nr:hypothetical protein GQ55_8G042400 [Panicum hallii var. hallii]